MGGLRQVILMGQSVSASTPLLYHLARNGVDVVYQSQGGRFAFRLAGPLARLARCAYQVQSTMSRSPARGGLARWSSRKLHNQAAALARYDEHAGEARPVGHPHAA